MGGKDAHHVPGLLVGEDFDANVKAALCQVLAVDSPSVKFVLDRSTGRAKSVEATEKNPKAAMDGEAGSEDNIFGYFAKTGGKVSLLYVHAPERKELGADAQHGSAVARVLEALANAGLPADTLTFVTRVSYGNHPTHSASTVFMNPLGDFVKRPDYVPRQ